jgi:hypothetical protein
VRRFLVPGEPVQGIESRQYWTSTVVRPNHWWKSRQPSSGCWPSTFNILGIAIATGIGGPSHRRQDQGAVLWSTVEVAGRAVRGRKGRQQRQPGIGQEGEHPAFAGTLSHGHDEPQFRQQPDEAREPGQRADDILPGGVRSAPHPAHPSACPCPAGTQRGKGAGGVRPGRSSSDGGTEELPLFREINRSNQASHPARSLFSACNRRLSATRPAFSARS